MKTIHYLYISIISLIGFFLLTIFIINRNPIFFDEPIRNLLTSIDATPFFLFITNLGNMEDLLLLILILCILFYKKINCPFVLAMMFLNTGGNVLLKSFFARPRPNYLMLMKVGGYSFPSGHAMGSLMFYGLLIYFLHQTKLPKIWKMLGTTILIILIFLIGASRVYLGVHYPSDVLGGYLFSTFLLSFGIFFLETTSQNKRRKNETNS